jgi:hypothetical protein
MVDTGTEEKEERGEGKVKDREGVKDIRKTRRERQNVIFGIFQPLREIPGEYTEMYGGVSFPFLSNSQHITFSQLVQPQNMQRTLQYRLNYKSTTFNT